MIEPYRFNCLLTIPIHHHLLFELGKNIVFNKNIYSNAIIDYFSFTLGNRGGLPLGDKMVYGYETLQS